jgi:N utilization substance protein A
MEISDLVNTIEGLTEEHAIEIVAQAETLAEEQVDDLPRRKGARSPAPVVEAETAGAGSGAGAGEDGRVTNASSPSFSDLFEAEESPLQEDGGHDSDESELASESIDDAPIDPRNGVEDLRDIAIAVESSGLVGEGHEVTSRPSNDDQDETLRIVTEAVESGPNPDRANATEVSEEPSTPPAPPERLHPSESTEEREPEMLQP